VNDRDYHKTMNGELFKKWVVENLIPALRLINSKCVVIMDNAPYHSLRLESPPTSASRKEIIKQWLTEHDMPFEDNFTKKQLLNLVRPFVNNSRFRRYEIDELLQAEGHEVLRLPPYNCQYNPTELAWGFCKTYYNQRIQARLGMKHRVVEIWREALEKCTQEKWVNLIRHSEKEVTSDFQKYMGVRDVTDIPPFIINTNSDISDSEDDFGLIRFRIK
jgi:transposase